MTLGEKNVPDQKSPYLKEFYAHSVWGKYEFHAEFKDGVNFISGLNGSNKSTLLYLIFGSYIEQRALDYLGSFVSRAHYSDNCQNTLAHFAELDEAKVSFVMQLSQKLQEEGEAGKEIKGDIFKAPPFTPNFLRETFKPLNFEKKSNLINLKNNTISSIWVQNLNVFGLSHEMEKSYVLPHIRISSPVVNDITLKENHRVKQTFEKERYSEIDSLLYDTVDRFLAYEYGLFEQVVESNMLNRDEVFKKRTQFESLVNSFFKETGKQIIRNDAKEIAFEFSDTGDKLDVISLSHGEKSLLYMLLIVFLEQKKVRIFLFDEPETALHLSWQKKLPDALVELAPNCQFILTTHSPGIVSGKWLPRLTDMSKIRKLMAATQ